MITTGRLKELSPTIYTTLRLTKWLFQSGGRLQISLSDVDREAGAFQEELAGSSEGSNKVSGDRLKCCVRVTVRGAL